MEKCKMVIYKATDKLSGWCYIGKTIKGLEERKKQHLYLSRKGQYKNFSFHYFLNRYEKDIYWEVICKCKDEDELDRLEKYYINYYSSFCVYNQKLKKNIKNYIYNR